MHNPGVPYFFFTNNTSAPQANTLHIPPLLGISFNCNFHSTNFGVLILYDAFDVGVAPHTNSIENSRSL